MRQKLMTQKMRKLGKHASSCKLLGTTNGWIHKSKHFTANQQLIIVKDAKLSFVKEGQRGVGIISTFAWESLSSRAWELQAGCQYQDINIKKIEMMRTEEHY